MFGRQEPARQNQARAAYTRAGTRRYAADEPKATGRDISSTLLMAFLVVLAALLAVYLFTAYRHPIQVAYTITAGWYYYCFTLFIFILLLDHSIVVVTFRRHRQHGFVCVHKDDCAYHHGRYG